MSNQKECTFSIVVPVYNVQDYVEECVRSVLEQSYGKFEILLVDDRSTDGSGLVCQKLASCDDRVFYYFKKNGGLSSARNYGVEKANGDYVYFLDSDDFIRDGALQAFSAYIDIYSHPDII